MTLYRPFQIQVSASNSTPPTVVKREEPKPKPPEFIINANYAAYLGSCHSAVQNYIGSAIGGFR